MAIGQWVAENNGLATIEQTVGDVGHPVGIQILGAPARGLRNHTQTWPHTLLKLLLILMLR